MKNFNSSIDSKKTRNFFVDYKGRVLLSKGSFIDFTYLNTTPTSGVVLIFTDPTDSIDYIFVFDDADLNEYIAIAS